MYRKDFKEMVKNSSLEEKINFVYSGWSLSASNFAKKYANPLKDKNNYWKVYFYVENWVKRNRDNLLNNLKEVKEIKENTKIYRLNKKTYYVKKTKKGFIDKKGVEVSFSDSFKYYELNDRIIVL